LIFSSCSSSWSCSIFSFLTFIVKYTTSCFLFFSIILTFSSCSSNHSNSCFLIIIIFKCFSTSSRRFFTFFFSLIFYGNYFFTEVIWIFFFIDFKSHFILSLWDNNRIWITLFFFTCFKSKIYQTRIICWNISSKSIA